MVTSRTYNNSGTQRELAAGHQKIMMFLRAAAFFAFVTALLGGGNTRKSISLNYEAGGLPTA
jgi:hypothetical protein